MEQRTLGSSGIRVSRMGFGGMSLSDAYGKADPVEGFATLRRARQLGINFFDTADLYGAGGNEEIYAKAFAECRNEVVLATKFGFTFSPEGAITGICGRPEYVHQCCTASLRRLGTEVIDLYYLHRPDPEVPIEETVGAMAQLVEQGKVRSLGLSEVSAEQLRCAHAVHPIAALQSEYSLWCLEIEDRCLEETHRLGITLVPFSPLGRGVLGGAISGNSPLSEGDWRRQLPKYQEENLRHNLQIVATLRDVAAAHNSTPAQVALAWLYAQDDGLVPIPGTKRRHYLEENIGALQLQLSPQQQQLLRQAAQRIVGKRYADGSFLRPPSG